LALDRRNVHDVHFQSAKCRIHSFPRFFFSKAHAGTAAVLVDELDARGDLFSVGLPLTLPMRPRIKRI
jgi:hypothetical protein